MDGHAVSPGDEAHDVVAGDGGAALGKLDQTVGKTLYDDTLFAAGALRQEGFCPVVGLGRFLSGLFQRLFLLVQLLNTLKLSLHPVNGLLRGEAAITDGGVHLVQSPVGYPLQKLRQIFQRQHVLHGNAAVLHLRFKGGPAVGDVFLSALFFEPLADFAAGLAGLGNFHPVPAGTLGGFRSENLHNVAVFQLKIIGDDPPVDFGPDHVIAHGGVNGIGKVDGGGSGGQVLYVAAGSKHKHLIREHIHL